MSNEFPDRFPGAAAISGGGEILGQNKSKQEKLFSSQEDRLAISDAFMVAPSSFAMIVRSRSDVKIR